MGPFRLPTLSARKNVTMKFHMPSYLMGLASALAVYGMRHRLRPVLVEVAALGTVLAKSAWAIVEQQREWVEDVVAEVDGRVGERLRRNRNTNGRAAEAAPPASS